MGKAGAGTFINYNLNPIHMESKERVIQFIITGGTIDSYYDGSLDTVKPSKSSAIPKFIENLKLYEKFEFTEVCMKDSREVNIADRKKILSAIQNSPNKLFIITHGTYTMPDTARYLKANLKRKDQTIVFTGSFVPLLGFSPSDAPFSLGYSVAKVQELPTGIYVCMNGHTFTPEEVVKLISEGKFSSIFERGKRS